MTQPYGFWGGHPEDEANEELEDRWHLWHATVLEEGEEEPKKDWQTEQHEMGRHDVYPTSLCKACRDKDPDLGTSKKYERYILEDHGKGYHDKYQNPNCPTCKESPPEGSKLRGDEDLIWGADDEANLQQWLDVNKGFHNSHDHFFNEKDECDKCGKSATTLKMCPDCALKVKDIEAHVTEGHHDVDKLYWMGNKKCPPCFGAKAMDDFRSFGWGAPENALRSRHASHKEYQSACPHCEHAAGEHKDNPNIFCRKCPEDDIKGYWKHYYDTNIGGNWDNYRTPERRDRIASVLGDNTEDIATFKDGWKIKRLNTYGDLEYEGTMMNNSVGMYVNDQTPYHERFPGMDGNDGHLMGFQGRGVIHSLRDENNIPHASFFHLEDSKYSHKPWVLNVGGISNGDVRADAQSHLMGYAQMLGQGKHPGEVMWGTGKRTGKWSIIRPDGSQKHEAHVGEEGDTSHHGLDFHRWNKELGTELPDCEPCRGSGQCGTCFGAGGDLFEGSSCAECGGSGRCSACQGFQFKANADETPGTPFWQNPPNKRALILDHVERNHSNGIKQLDVLHPDNGDRSISWAMARGEKAYFLHRELHNRGMADHNHDGLEWPWGGQEFLPPRLRSEALKQAERAFPDLTAPMAGATCMLCGDKSNPDKGAIKSFVDPANPVYARLEMHESCFLEYYQKLDGQGNNLYTPATQIGPEVLPHAIPANGKVIIQIFASKDENIQGN